MRCGCATRCRTQYLLWVGGLKTPDPHKRVAQLTRAKRSLPLVLVGPSGPWAHELPDVTLTGEVSDDDLAAIYTGARALVLASSDEGFGLTPVEALACGTPVAACDVPAVREVLGERVELLPPDDLDALIRAAEAATRPAPDAAGLDLGGRGRRDLGRVRNGRSRAGAGGSASRGDRCRLSIAATAGTRAAASPARH